MDLNFRGYRQQEGFDQEVENNTKNPLPSNFKVASDNHENGVVQSADQQLRSRMDLNSKDDKNTEKPPLPSNYELRPANHGNGVVSPVKRQLSSSKKTLGTHKNEIHGDQTIHTCFVCSKSFLSSRSLHGHMRCHPDRQWRGIQPPSTRSGPNLAIPGRWSNKDKRGRNSIAIDTDDERVSVAAEALLMLAASKGIDDLDQIEIEQNGFKDLDKHMNHKTKPSVSAHRNILVKNKIAKNSNVDPELAPPSSFSSGYAAEHNLINILSDDQSGSLLIAANKESALDFDLNELPADIDC